MSNFDKLYKLRLTLTYVFDRWQVDPTETEEVKISHAVTNFEVIIQLLFKKK
jgi:hypothetical protein